MAQASHNERRMRRVKNENRFLRLELRKMVHELYVARTVAVALEAELKKHDQPAKLKGVNSVSDLIADETTNVDYKIVDGVPTIE